MTKIVSLSLIFISVVLTLVSLVHLAQGDEETIADSLIALKSFILSLIKIPSSGGGWFYEYQTLIAGALASSSVFLTWYNYSSNLKRKNFAARAGLNDPLSAVCSYSSACFKAIKNDGVMPERCSEGIRILKDSIEFLDKNTAEVVFELVSHYQVHNARLEKYFDDKIAPDSIAYIGDSRTERLYDAVKLYCLASRLFGYARNNDRYNQKVKSVSYKKLSQYDMHSALNGIYGISRQLMAHQDLNLSGLIEKIDRAHS